MEVKAYFQTIVQHHQDAFHAWEREQQEKKINTTTTKKMSGDLRKSDAASLERPSASKGRYPTAEPAPEEEKKKRDEDEDERYLNWASPTIHGEEWVGADEKGAPPPPFAFPIRDPERQNCTEAANGTHEGRREGTSASGACGGAVWEHCAMETEEAERSVEENHHDASPTPFPLFPTPTVQEEGEASLFFRTLQTTYHHTHRCSGGGDPHSLPRRGGGGGGEAVRHFVALLFFPVVVAAFLPDTTALLSEVDSVDSMMPWIAQSSDGDQTDALRRVLALRRCLSVHRRLLLWKLQLVEQLYKEELRTFVPFVCEEAIQPEAKWKWSSEEAEEEETRNEDPREEVAADGGEREDMARSARLLGMERRTTSFFSLTSASAFQEYPSEKGEGGGTHPLEDGGTAGQRRGGKPEGEASPFALNAQPAMAGPQGRKGEDEGRKSPVVGHPSVGRPTMAVPPATLLDPEEEEVVVEEEMVEEEEGRRSRGGSSPFSFFRFREGEEEEEEEREVWESRVEGKKGKKGFSYRHARSIYDPLRQSIQDVLQKLRGAQVVLGNTTIIYNTTKTNENTRGGVEHDDLSVFLNIVAVVVIPLNVIACQWGMNCYVPGKNSDSLLVFWCIMGVMLLGMVGGLAYPLYMFLKGQMDRIA